MNTKPGLTDRQAFEFLADRESAIAELLGRPSPDTASEPTPTYAQMEYAEGERRFLDLVEDAVFRLASAEREANRLLELDGSELSRTRRDLARAYRNRLIDLHGITAADVGPLPAWAQMEDT